MDVSVFRATPASGRRSRSKRPTSSAMKCCASAADPPLPHARILLLFASAPNSTSTLVASGSTSSRALALKVSTASSKCDVMCAVMSMAPIISFFNLEEGGWPLFGEGVAYPFQLALLDAHDVEAAGRRAPLEM